jgi:hypothetical protein
LFNLLLFSDKLGRRALSRDQRWQAISVGGLLLAALTLALFTALVSHDELNSFGYAAAIGIALISLPASAVFICKPSWPRRTMLFATSILALIALIPLFVWIYAEINPHGSGVPVDIATDFWKNAFLPGFIGSQFLAMWLAQIRPVR